MTTVLRWLTAGHREAEIVEAVAERWPHTNAAQLLARVLTQIQTSADVPEDYLRGWLYESRKELLRQFLEIGDQAGARQILRDIEAADAKHRRQPTVIETTGQKRWQLASK